MTKYLLIILIVLYSNILISQNTTNPPIKDNENIFNSSFAISKSFDKNFNIIYFIDTTTETLEWEKILANTKCSFDKEKKKLVVINEDSAALVFDIHLTEFITYESEDETYVFAGFNKTTNSSCAVLLYLDGNIGIQIHKESNNGERGAMKFEFRKN